MSWFLKGGGHPYLGQGEGRGHGRGQAAERVTLSGIMSVFLETSSSVHRAKLGEGRGWPEMTIVNEPRNITL